MADSMYCRDYWRHDGFLDAYRMPLKPPYELYMTDVIDYASIQTWRGDYQSSLSGIIRYEIRGYWIFGERSDQWSESRRTEQEREWFIFDLTNGSKVLLKDYDEFILELKILN